jgi:Tol biopolymer transport system component
MFGHKWTSVLIWATLLSLSCDDNKRVVNPPPYPPWPPPVAATVDANPDWSHAGDRVAYASYFDSSGAYQVGIYVTDSTGVSKSRTGVFGYCARWLPGDSQLVIIGDWGTRFKILNLRTGALDTLDVRSAFPTFDLSPDGQFIYFCNYPSIDSIWSTGIYRYCFADSSVLPITDGWMPSISPDGNKVAFTRGPVFVMDIPNGSITALTTSTYAEMPAWTADGEHVIYYDVNSKYAIYRAKLSGERQFLTYGGGAMSVSPDGRKLLYNNIFEVDSLGFIRLWLLDLNTLETRQFTH